MHKGYKKTVAILITCVLMSALVCVPVSAAVTEDSISLGGVSIQGAQLHRLFGTWEDSGTGIDVGTDGTNLIINASTPDGWGANAGAYFKFEYVLNFDNLKPSDVSNITFDVSVIPLLYDGATSSVFTANCFVRDFNNLSVGSVTKVNNTTLRYRLSSFKGSAIKVASCFNQPSGYVYAYRLTISNIGINTLGTQDIINNQNNNTDKEIQADKENTQAIIDNQNELAEQEKQEITDSGNQATDAMDSIPNESEGFINALGTFVSTMSTTDTACSITFPAIKTPSFAGIPAATLSEEKEVDFSTAISLIPSDIMKLIQALTTIALIVFCFKELYDTISEALTRKKANSDG